MTETRPRVDITSIADFPFTLKTLEALLCARDKSGIDTLLKRVKLQIAVYAQEAVSLGPEILGEPVRFDKDKYRVLTSQQLSEGAECIICFPSVHTASGQLFSLPYVVPQKK